MIWDFLLVLLGYSKRVELHFFTGYKINTRFGSSNIKKHFRILTKKALKYRKKTLNTYDCGLRKPLICSYFCF